MEDPFARLQRRGHGGRVLHDTLEATGTTRPELELRFGATVEHLVCCLTEDSGIEDAQQRKSALRDQVGACDCEANTIYAADKLSKVRELRIRLHGEPALAATADGQRKLTHYWRSLTMLCAPSPSTRWSSSFASSSKPSATSRPPGRAGRR